MEQISLFALYEKHSEDFKISQVAQILHQETDTLYEFLYDHAANKAILDVVSNRSSVDFTRTTYQFDDADISIAKAFEVFGIRQFNIKINLSHSFEAVNNGVYIGLPIVGLDIAQGIITIDPVAQAMCL